VSTPTVQSIAARAARIIDAVESRGNDPRDLRDAAHEACHALMFGVRPGQWDRETIHRAIKRRRNVVAESIYGNRLGGMVDAEIVARAVEQVVCSDLGVDCGSIETWAHVAWMEAWKGSGISLPTDSWLTDRIRRAMAKDDRVRSLADKVIALKPYRPRQTSPAPILAVLDEIAEGR
jgi:hypothetical protein